MTIQLQPARHYYKQTEAILKGRGSKPEIIISSLPTLNDKLHGIHKKKLHVIGARTSMGKTAFVLQLTSDILKSGKSVLFLSFESEPEELIERIFINQYQIDNIELLKGGYEKYATEWADFEKYLGRIKFIIAKSFGADIKQVSELMTQLDPVPDVIIIDYIQSVAKVSTEGKAFIDEYIRFFREICVKHNIAGLLVSQLNRATQETESKTPQLHNLKGSGFLEEHADICLLLDWSGKGSKNENTYTIYVAKNRTGRTGYLNLMYFPQYYLFSEVEVVAKQEEIDINA